MPPNIAEDAATQGQSNHSTAWLQTSCGTRPHHQVRQLSAKQSAVQQKRAAHAGPDFAGSMCRKCAMNLTRTANRRVNHDDEAQPNATVDCAPTIINTQLTASNAPMSPAEATAAPQASTHT
jgi:RNase P subunit RPR2